VFDVRAEFTVEVPCLSYRIGQETSFHVQGQVSWDELLRMAYMTSPASGVEVELSRLLARWASRVLKLC